MPKENIGGVGIYYEVHGEGQETIAFVNGVGMTSQMWYGVMEPFKKNYKCILHDTRGQLLSDKPEGDYSLEMHVKDLKNLLDHLGINKVHLVGTSYGSEISMIFAYTYPEITKSISVITGVSETDGVLKAAVESWIEGARLSPVCFYKTLKPWAYSSDYIEKNNNVFLEREKAMDKMPKDFFTGFIKLCEAFLKIDITKNLNKIKCPTLVLSAELDIIKPAKFGKIIHDNIKGSEFEILKNCAHTIVLEAPLETAEKVMNFIKKHI
jgi:3-oxoadipate enol-lactonase